MLSYTEMQRAARIIDPVLRGTVVQRIMQIDEFSITLTFRGFGGDRHLYLSCRPEFARLSLVPEAPKEAMPRHTFLQYCRAHLMKAAFQDIGTKTANRQISLRLSAADGVVQLILSVLGARSNIYLLNPEGKLSHAMRPLDETRRELVLGGFWTDPEGRPPVSRADRWEDVPDEHFFAEVERAYRQAECARESEALVRKLENGLGKELAFLARKGANLQEDLGEAHEADRYRRMGELLKGVLHEIKPGDESARAIDFETGEILNIPLDPELSPAANLEAYFARYQKESRSLTAVEQQIEVVLEAQAAVEALQQELRVLTACPAPDLEALRIFADKPRVRRLLLRYYPLRKPQPSVRKVAGKTAIPVRLLPKRYRTADGLEIWVGKSDEGNDYLTTRLARGNDLFFHLEGYPGSHVILRTDGRTDPPSSSMLAACELAVHFSRLKSAGRADVHVACVKNVMKPRGAKRGLVHVARGRTIHLRRDPKRLEDILASRLDE